MKQTQIIIIPGFGESGRDTAYKKLKEEIEQSKKLTVSFYNPTWDGKTILNWVEDFNIKYKDTDTTKMILIGFSMGATISLILAEQNKFKKVILASLSPYFKENLKYTSEDTQKFWGKTRMEAFSKISIPKSIQAESTFLFGENDWAMAIEQAEKLSSKFGGNFDLIDKTSHELTEEYIKKIVSSL